VGKPLFSILQAAALFAHSLAVSEIYPLQSRTGQTLFFNLSPKIIIQMFLMNVSMEVYQQLHPDMDFSARFAAARTQRREQNRKVNCQSCLTR